MIKHADITHAASSHWYKDGAAFVAEYPTGLVSFHVKFNRIPSSDK